MVLAVGLGSARAQAAAPTPPADPPELGVNAELTQYDAAELEHVLARLARAGIRTVRQPVRWAELEPEPGRLDWAKLDRVALALQRYGLRMLATVHTAPAWARHDPLVDQQWWVCTDPATLDPSLADRAPPTDPADLARFLETFVGRYRGSLAAIEIWREPNLLPNWRRAGPNPEEYALLLTAGAAAVRRAAPEIRVLSAGLAPTTEMNVCHLSDVVFLDRLARTGALARVDAVGIEPFGLRTGPEDGRVDREALNFSRAVVLHDLLQHRSADRPLWAVAWGWNALPESWTGQDSPWGSHAPDLAARWIRMGWARARAEWPWMGPMFLWHLQPEAGPEDPVWGFALLDPNFAPTPLWPAAADIAAGGVRPVRLSPPQPSHVALALVVMIAVLATAMVASRRRAAGLLRPLLTPLERLSPPWAGFLYGAAAVVDIVGPWPASLVALPLMGLLATVHPLVAIAGVAAAAPLYFGVTMRLGPTPIGVVELMILLALAGRLLAAYLAWAAEGWPGPTIGVRARLGTAIRAAPALDWTVVALVAWAGISLLWAEHRAPAVHEWRTVILEPAVYYGLLRTMPDRRAAARAALAGLVIGALAAAGWALAGLGRYALGDSANAVVAEGVVRLRGPYGSPNNLALMLGRVLVVLVAVMVWGAGRWRRIALLAAAPIALALFLTFSRGALLVGLPILVVFLALASGPGHRRWRPLAAALVALLVIAALLLPFAGTERLAESFAARPGSTLFTRLRLWESTIEMVQDHPWLGVGLDNFLYLYRERYVKRDVIQEAALNHPHNALLDWWTRLGLPGVLIFLTLVAGNLRVGWRALARGPEDRALAIAALGMQVYAVAHGLVDNHFFLVDLAVIWWIAQATLLAARPAPDPPMTA